MRAFEALGWLCHWSKVTRVLNRTVSCWWLLLLDPRCARVVRSPRAASLIVLYIGRSRTPVWDFFFGIRLAHLLSIYGMLLLYIYIAGSVETADGIMRIASKQYV